MSADVVERVRMALAEAGYPNACAVMPYDDEDADDHVGEPGVPLPVFWRAHVVAGDDTDCLACVGAWNEIGCPHPWESGCLAFGEGIEDCGVDRPSVAS